MQLGAKEVLHSRPRVLLDEALNNAPDRLFVLDLGVNRQHSVIINSSRKGNQVAN